MAAGFFRQIGKPEQLADAVFEVAYFWRLSPDTVMEFPLDKFETYQRQASRLAEMMRGENG